MPRILEWGELASHYSAGRYPIVPMPEGGPLLGTERFCRHVLEYVTPEAIADIYNKNHLLTRKIAIQLQDTARAYSDVLEDAEEQDRISRGKVPWIAECSSACQVKLEDEDQEIVHQFALTFSLVKYHLHPALLQSPDLLIEKHGVG